MAMSLCAASGRFDLAVAASSSSTDLPSRRCLPQVVGVSVCGPVVKARLTSVRENDSRSSSLSSSSQVTHGADRSRGPIAPQRNGMYIDDVTPGSNSVALIDIQDSADGSVTFTYGAVEDLWHLDKMLEYLCRGAFNTHTAESFVPLVIDLFRVPVSLTERRRMVELLSSYTRWNDGRSPADVEKMVSQVLTEAASMFLPPSSIGNYTKASPRPAQRYSSPLDYWWKTVDNYLGVDLEGVKFLPVPSYMGGDRVLTEYKEWSKSTNEHFESEFRQNNDVETEEKEWTSISTDEDFKSEFRPNFEMETTEFTWQENSPQESWLAKQPHTIVSGVSSETSAVHFGRGNGSSLGLSETEYIAGLGFVLLTAQLKSLEDSLRKTQVEEEAPHSSSNFTPFKSLETLPVSSIRAMIEWEQDETAMPSSVSLPSSQVTEKKTKQRSSTKTNQRIRAKTNSSKTAPKAASKRKTTTDSQNVSRRWDLFFGLPLTHKSSGVAKFLVLQENHSKEMLLVLNQVAVGLAGAGLAVTLQVAARMLSVNSTFDYSKLFRVVRGVGLVWISTAIQSLRRLMLGLPPGCTVSNSKDKEQVLCLQRNLRSLSFRALAVMVVAVVSCGV